jgi:gas vesicle protein
MADNDTLISLDPSDGNLEADHGGFVALAVLAAAMGAGAALLLAPEEGARTRERVGRGLRSLRGEAAETIAQLQREMRKRRRQSRREKQIIALAGVLIGAGLTAILAPASGAVTRQRLGGTISRIKVGAVDRIERLRQQRQGETAAGGKEENPAVRSVQELGRDSNSVF